MRIITTALLVAALGVSAHAQPDEQAGAQSAPDTSKSVAEAKALLGEVAKVYRKAPTIDDTMTMKASGPFAQEAETVTVTMGQGDHSRFSVTGMTLTTLDGSLYLELEDSPDKYLQIDLKDDIPKTLEDLFGSGGGLPFQYLMRFGPTDADHVESFGMGLIRKPMLEGVRKTAGEDGKPLSEVTIAGENGSVLLLIDPKTRLVMKQQVSADPPPGVPADQAMQLTFTFKPRIADKLEKPITFEPGGREKVGTIEELFPPPPEPPMPVSIGQPAPDFSLQTPDGETVALKDLRGQMVVLDFWATWCGWCIKAMPLLQEFHDWTRSTDQPVKVFAVNCWERKKTTEQVVEFWKGKGWTIPILLDKGDALVESYGFTGIPATVIVGPDGKVANIHRGYSPEMVSMLKADAAKALKTDK